jgi:hypothetical protein
MKKEWKHCAAEGKVASLRRHLVENVPVSELCDKPGLQPTVFYQFFENGAAAYEQKRPPSHSPTRSGSPLETTPGEL